jgi:hypothetical protein
VVNYALSRVPDCTEEVPTDINIFSSKEINNDRTEKKERKKEMQYCGLRKHKKKQRPPNFDT